MELSILKKTALGVAIAMLASCGGGDSGSGNNKTKSEAGSQTEQTSGSSTNELVGDWSFCNQFTLTSTKTTVTFTDTVFTKTTGNYQSNDCSGSQDGAGLTVSGTYTIGDAVTSANGYQSRKLDVAFLNIYGDYVDYDIYHINGDELYFSALPNTKEESRPTEIFLNYVYIKES